MSNSTNIETISSVYPVILCGGSGARLWPVSRKSLPKQFIELVTEQSMFQDTVQMVEKGGLKAPVIVTNQEFQYLVDEQLAEVDITPACVILEPLSKNTAASIALAALELAETDRDACMLVLPSDHVIDNADAFFEAVSNAHEAAKNGLLVTFGMCPNRPETGYGYIRLDQSVPHGTDCFHVAEFVEKPDLNTAKIFIEDGRYYWNSGMFMFKASRFLEDLGRYAPSILWSCIAAKAKGKHQGHIVTLDEDNFALIENTSIDYAVMEHTNSAAMVIADFGWSDVGSWTALAELGCSDEKGNVVEGDSILIDCKATYIRGSGRLVAAIGLENQVIIDTEDAILIAAKDRVQDIKAVVKQLRDLDHKIADEHVKVRRPWGTYEGIHHGEMHQVKHIVVNPGGKLSTQYHHHRAEHWIIVSGTAEATIDGETMTLHENNSVFIPLGSTHRLFNPNDQPLHLIEVQYGDYLGEDDIVRIDDIYGRVPEDTDHAKIDDKILPYVAAQ